MKVSRKVARRKRASYPSFVTSRRLRKKNSKSGYRKKFTQRGGKRGKLARSRGYKHIYTHKRGKRFHRGGFECSGFTTNENTGYLELVIPEQTLYVKKNGILVQGGPTQTFSFTLQVKTTKKLIQDISKSSPTTQFVVTFERNTKSKNDNDNVSFSISDLSYFTDIQKQKQTRRIQSDKDTYDFSDSRNKELFTKIAECIQPKLSEQVEQLKAYYKETKDLLEHCKIAILSSMDSLQADMVTSDKISDVLNSWGSLTQDIPFFSFILLLYYDSETRAIDKEKTIKLLELLKSLDKYGIFSYNCRGRTNQVMSSFAELKNKRDEIKKKFTDLISLCETISASSEFGSSIKEIKDYNTSLNNIKLGTTCIPGKITDLGQKVVVLVRVNQESSRNSAFLDYDGVPKDALTTYVSGLPPIPFDPDAYKTKQTEQTEQSEKDIINKEKQDAIEDIKRLKEEIKAHKNDNSKVRNFLVFKNQQEELAEKLKDLIDSRIDIDEQQKNIRKGNVDFYLKKILETQLEYMKKSYIAYQAYSSFPTHSDSGGTTRYDGLGEKDNTYTDYKLKEVLDNLKNNVEAFRYRMEQQAEVYSNQSDTLVSITDDSNFRIIFPECVPIIFDSNGNSSGKPCYKELTAAGNTRASARPDLD